MKLLLNKGGRRVKAEKAVAELTKARTYGLFIVPFIFWEEG